ncbi:hypothetical protein [Salinibius halmophilus]|uniref:hypothetical protein n=1 Tax=Salinibius halmophilus TaxID=1853216 RepID=UPI000E65FC1B|nr:hypothetical protein [Salinibius halmophilus]
METVKRWPNDFIHPSIYYLVAGLALIIALVYLVGAASLYELYVAVFWAIIFAATGAIKQANAHHRYKKIASAGLLLGLGIGGYLWFKSDDADIIWLVLPLGLISFAMVKKEQLSLPMQK